MRDSLIVPVINGDIESSLRKLKKLVIVTGAHAAMQRHECYVKPGEAKRIKSLKARRKAWKAAKRRAVWERPDG